ncbi:hypothetical protein OBP_302 [Pseudomonas phage OBP]|uniref:hypothetical protein n=1 Tax=Pseudomonas phage OBP TaxID=1124849 RepID=UPI000240D649|nr:hypothetical protein OBP_302 [Pseudomonas phage OBP]AEV89739.1 hypothetical protein OBP_302 [Pseudomonas phage OBP]
MSRIWNIVIGLSFLAAALIVGMNPSHAATPPVGWHLADPEVKELSHLKIISNRGDLGGELSLICNKDTKKISLTYSFDGKQYDFYIVRNFGDSNPTAEGKLLVGAGDASQGDVFWHLMRNDQGFSIDRFPVGTKKIWDDSVAKAVKSNGDVTPPDIKQEGEEFFISGPKTNTLLNHVGAYCPLVPGDNAPVL